MKSPDGLNVQWPGHPKWVNDIINSWVTDNREIMNKIREDRLKGERIRRTSRHKTHYILTYQNDTSESPFCNSTKELQNKISYNIIPY